MSESVFVVSEWLAKDGCDRQLWDEFNILLAMSKKEPGCIRAHVTRQISHPGSPSKSKYTIILLQEYSSIEAFDDHCDQDYVKNFFGKYIDSGESSIVADWKCRLFSESGND